MKDYYVYIMASKPNGTLYIGVTSNLLKRVYEHKTNTFKGFTEKYEVKLLVYYEIYSDIEMAITREKNMKAWKRLWKIQSIAKENPQWHDLYETLAGSQLSLG